MGDSHALKKAGDGVAMNDPFLLVVPRSIAGKLQVLGSQAITAARAR